MRVASLFRPPRFEDPEARRIARTLVPVGWIFVATAAGALLFGEILDIPHTSPALSAAGLAAGLTGLVLAARGRLRTAATLLMSVSWIVLAMRAVEVGFVGPALACGFMVVVLATGVLLGPWTAAAATLASAAVPLGLLAVGASPPSEAFTATDALGWVGATSIVIVAGGALSLLATLHIRDALADSRRHQSALQERNRDLREREARYRTLVESLPMAIFELDVDGRILGINSRGPELTDTGSVRRLTGKRLLDALGGETNEAVTGALARARAGESCEFELETTTGGRSRILVASLIPLRGPDGAVTKLIGHMKDVTDRRRLEQQVQESRRLESLSMLAGGIAHDFNNLLVGIQGNAELALTGLEPDAPARRALVDIESAGQTAAGLTRQLMTYAGRGHATVDTFELSGLIRETAQRVASSLSKEVALQLDAGDEAWVTGDPILLRQLAVNLIVNAAESYDGAAGVVEVRGERRRVEREELGRCHLADGLPAAVYAVLKISDDGGGMDADTRRRIFDPFFTTKLHGRGLGLAAVQGIVRNHGGAVAVESHAGGGTTVRVYLPTVEARGTSPDAATDRRAVSLSRGAILVVDDEPMVRRVARRMLEQSGWRVLEAADGSEGVARLREDPDQIACVLLDRTMPGMNGEETCRALRALRRDLPVLFVSGDIDPSLSDRVITDERLGFVQKPFRSADLQRRVRELLADA